MTRDCMHRVVMPWACGILALSSPLLAVVTAEKKAVAVRAARVEEETLAEIPESDDAEHATVGPAMDRVAWVAERGKKHVMIVNGQSLGGEYDSMHAPQFGRDGRTVGFMASRGGHPFFVVEGADLPVSVVKPGDKTMFWRDPVFSIDGRHVGRWVERGKKAVLIVDGQDAGEYDDAGPLCFSPLGDRLAYAGRRGEHDVLVVDGREMPTPFGQVKSLTFDPTGKTLLAAVKAGKKWRMVVNGEPGAEFAKVLVEAWWPSFSVDGAHFAYGVMEAGMMKVVVDGQVGPPLHDLQLASWECTVGTPLWSGLDAGSIRKDRNRNTATSTTTLCGASVVWFGPGAGKAAYAGRRGDRWFMVVDGKPGPEFTSVGVPSFSKDGEHVCYRAVASKKGAEVSREVVVSDGVVGPEFGRVVGDPILTPDGKSVLYVVWDEAKKELYEVRDHTQRRQLPAEERGRLTSVAAENLAVCPEGRRTAIVIARGGVRFHSDSAGRALRRVVIDAKPGKDYDALRIEDLAFGPDGNHVAYWVRDDKALDGKSLVVLDDAEGVPYDEVFPNSLHFSANDTVRYVARQGDRYVRVTQRLP